MKYRFTLDNINMCLANVCFNKNHHKIDENDSKDFTSLYKIVEGLRWLELKFNDT